MHLSDERAIVILLVGATAGLLLSKLVRGTGLGMIGDGAVGIVGAFVAIGSCYGSIFISAAA